MPKRARKRADSPGPMLTPRRDSPKGAWRWLFRGSRAVEYPLSRLTKKKIEELVRLAKWVVAGYKDDVQPPDKGDGAKFCADGRFLKATIVEQKKCLDCGDVIFWFADSISPHLWLFRKRRRNKLRFPYYYNSKTGLILPLDRLGKRNCMKFEKFYGARGRRVDFRSQPNFVAQVVKSGNEVRVLFRGTDKFKVSDWVEDVMQFLGMIPPQFRLASDLVHAICETVAPDEKILLVGHSEGGGEVQYSLMQNARQRWVGHRDRMRGVTFNSQRLSPVIMEKLLCNVSDEYAKRNIVNYRTCRDVVSGMLALGVNLIGMVWVIGAKRSRYSITAHLMTSLIRDLERACHEADNITQLLHN